MAAFIRRVGGLASARRVTLLGIVAISAGLCAVSVCGLLFTLSGKHPILPVISPTYWFGSHPRRPTGAELEALAAKYGATDYQGTDPVEALAAQYGGKVEPAKPDPWAVVSDEPIRITDDPVFKNHAINCILFGILPMVWVSMRMWDGSDRRPLVEVQWRRYLKVSGSARIGILLAVTWLLCRWGSEGGGRSTAWRFGDFWWRIGQRFDPTQGWLVIPIAMAILFALPIFVEWSLRPVLARPKRTD